MIHSSRDLLVHSIATETGAERRENWGRDRRGGECAKGGTRREGEGMKRRRVRWCVRAGARRGGKSKSVQVEEGWGEGNRERK